MEILPSGWAILTGDTVSCSADVRRTGSIYVDPFGSFNICRPYWNKGSTVIDVGSHIGTWSVPMGESVGVLGTVISIEPDPELCECIKHNMRLIDCRSSIIESAVWEESGTIVFLRNMENRGSSGVDPESKNRGHHIDMEVTSIKIDDLSLSEVSFIKMDIEGAELKGLKGANETLKAFRPVLFIETVPSAPQFFGSSLEEMYDWLRSAGYRLTFYPLPSGVPGHGSPFPHDVLCEWFG